MQEDIFDVINGLARDADATLKLLAVLVVMAIVLVKVVKSGLSIGSIVIGIIVGGLALYLITGGGLQAMGQLFDQTFGS